MVTTLENLIIGGVATDAAFAECSIESFTPDSAMSNGSGADSLAVVPATVTENESDGYGGARGDPENAAVMAIAVRSPSLSRLAGMVKALRSAMKTLRGSAGVLRLDLNSISYSVASDDGEKFVAVASYEAVTRADVPVTGV